MTWLSVMGRGLLAGAAGTAAMTVAQAIEMRRTGRPPSRVPARAVERISGYEVADPRAEMRLATVTHWLYGSAWGVPRALLAAAGVHGAAATALHLGAVWGAASAMLPRLGLAPPVTRWTRKSVATDLAFHAVYAAAVAAALGAALRRR